MSKLGPQLLHQEKAEKQKLYEMSVFNFFFFLFPTFFLSKQVYYHINGFGAHLFIWIRQSRKEM